MRENARRGILKKAKEARCADRRMNMPQKEENPQFLECESRLIYGLLMAAGGLLGAFTYLRRGGVFCNAQTGNFVLLSMALGGGRFSEAAYYFIPITAYMLGAFASELLFEYRMNRQRTLRWETLLVLFEVAVVFALGFVPDSAPYQISQVAINFICSMQYNTFRQMRGVPMATTFCTNHIRQVGLSLARLVNTGRGGARRIGVHLYMLCAFVAGGAAGTVLCTLAGGKAIWGAGALLLWAFFDLLHADLTTERALHHQKPRGH